MAGRSLTPQSYSCPPISLLSPNETIPKNIYIIKFFYLSWKIPYVGGTCCKGTQITKTLLPGVSNWSNFYQICAGVVYLCNANLRQNSNSDTKMNLKHGVCNEKRQIGWTEVLTFSLNAPARGVKWKPKIWSLPRLEDLNLVSRGLCLSVICHFMNLTSYDLDPSSYSQFEIKFYLSLSKSFDLSADFNKN